MMSLFTHIYIFVKYKKETLNHFRHEKYGVYKKYTSIFKIFFDILHSGLVLPVVVTIELSTEISVTLSAKKITILSFNIRDK